MCRFKGDLSVEHQKNPSKNIFSVKKSIVQLTANSSLNFILIEVLNDIAFYENTWNRKQVP